MKSPNPDPQSIAVIGGGIIGLTCALALLRDGCRVTLLDPDSTTKPASWGNAGHIAVEQAEPIASPATVRSFARRLFWRGGALALPPRDIRHWLPFALRLLRASTPAGFAKGRSALAPLLASAMPAWQRLVARIDRPDLLRIDGHYVVWESPATAAAGRVAWGHADTGTARIRDVTPCERARLNSLVTAPIADAIRFEGSGQITDLADLADAIRHHFVQQGGHLHTGRAAALPISGGVLLDDGATLPADRIVVAAGVAARALLEPLGHRVPIIAERGYHLQSAATDWPADLPPVVFEDRAMIVTRFRTGLRAASFVEFGTPAGPPDPRKWDRLRSHIKALGLPFPGPDAPWMGSRPTLPDYLPAIGRCPRAPHILYAFGHNHLGLTLAATTAELVAALVNDAPAKAPLAPFGLDRFGLTRSGCEMRGSMHL